MSQFIVSYNNSFRILRSLPMRCSARAMFTSSNVDSCQARIRRSIYILEGARASTGLCVDVSSGVMI